MASEEAGYIANNPQSSLWGDTHHYDYKWFRNWFKNQKDPDNNLWQIRSNNWEWQNYPKTRFASEYGFQAFPAFSVLEPVIRVSKMKSELIKISTIFAVKKTRLLPGQRGVGLECGECLDGSQARICLTRKVICRLQISGKIFISRKKSVFFSKYQAKSLSYTKRVVLQIQGNILQTPL